MKKSFLISTIILATAVFAEPMITAAKVGDGVDVTTLKPTDATWAKAKSVEVVCYPQTTIILNDKTANEINKNPKAKAAKIAALYNAKGIAFKITWADGTHNTQKPNSSDSYGDGVAVQFAKNFNDPKALPYIGMGSEGRPVVVYLQKAVEKHFAPDGNGDVGLQVNRNNTLAFGEELKAFDKQVAATAKDSYHKAFVSEGFRSMTEIKEGNGAMGMHMSYDNSTWNTSIARALKDDNLDISSAGTLPVAFAIWDGEALGRDGLKYLSTWVAVQLEGKKENQELVAELTNEPTGDKAAGEAQVKAMCASCHRFGDQQTAPLAMGPGLSNIGGYSTTAYLAESIKSPSAVVVPGYNRNAHKNYAWYTVDGNGTRTSTMPPMMSDDKSINDAVAYLKTLKAEVE